MSWLNQSEHDLVYVCEDGHETILRHDFNTKPAELPCAACGKDAGYVSFLPVKVGIKTSVSYEQNGRQAYRVTQNGNVTHISKTKMEYMRTGQNKSHVTKEFQGVLKDNMDKEISRYAKSLENNSNATVTAASKKEITSGGSSE